MNEYTTKKQHLNEIPHFFKCKFVECFPLEFYHIDRRDDEGDEGTQATNINELFDYALELLWTLVTKNGWDQTKLPDISEGFSYVSK